MIVNARMALLAMGGGASAGAAMFGFLAGVTIMLTSLHGSVFGYMSRSPMGGA